MSNGVDFRKLSLDLRGQLTAAESELAAEKSSSAGIYQQLEICQRQRDAAQSELAVMQKQLGERWSEISAFKETVERQEGELAALREDLDTALDMIKRSRERNTKLRKRLTAAEQRNAIREDLLNQCMHAFNHVVGFSDQAARTAWYQNFLKPVSGAILVHLSECAKPTESGESE